MYVFKVLKANLFYSAVAQPGKAGLNKKNVFAQFDWRKIKHE